MSATDELRRLLDERGVEHLDSEDDTTIYYADSGYRYTYNVNPESGWAQLFGYNLTPEQAITATLGRGTCHMRLAYEEEDADGIIWPDHYECGACGANVNGIMPYYDTEIPPKFCPNCGRRVEGGAE